MSTRTRMGLVAAAVAIAVVAFIVANPGGSSHKSSAVTHIPVLPVLLENRVELRLL